MYSIACDDSCKGSCSGPGPGNCYECAPGYIRQDEDGDCEGVISFHKKGGVPCVFPLQLEFPYCSSNIFFPPQSCLIYKYLF